jgi:hypothetical protein
MTRFLNTRESASVPLLETERFELQGSGRFESDLCHRPAEAKNFDRDHGESGRRHPHVGVSELGPVSVSRRPTRTKPGTPDPSGSVRIDEIS